MGKEFSSPVIDQINSAVGTLQTTVNNLQSSDVANIANNIGKLAERGQSVTGGNTGSHQSNTILNVSGSGVLMGLLSTNSAQSWSVQLDGGSIFTFILGNASIGAFDYMGLRFNSSLVVKCSAVASSAIQGYYRLD